MTTQPEDNVVLELEPEDIKEMARKLACVLCWEELAADWNGMDKRQMAPLVEVITKVLDGTYPFSELSEAFIEHAEALP